ncbi:MAG: MOSC domain-containing protein [Burkholderiales bacterium]
MRHSTVEGVFAGKLAILEEGEPTGIFKLPVTGNVLVSTLGLAGDVQADRRYHGGPEQALNHFPAEHYATLARLCPQQAPAFVPGSVGENISTRGWDENNVHIGDIFQAGAAVLQVSQPRSPCWKIDRRFGLTGLSREIAERAITGWYYRVLREGLIASGCEFTLLERNPAPVPVFRLWRAHMQAQPDSSELEQLAVTPGLNQEWAKKLKDRAEWLRKNSNAA